MHGRTEDEIYVRRQRHINNNWRRKSCNKRNPQGKSTMPIFTSRTNGDMSLDRSHLRPSTCRNPNPDLLETAHGDGVLVVGTNSESKIPSSSSTKRFLVKSANIREWSKSYERHGRSHKRTTSMDKFRGHLDPDDDTSGQHGTSLARNKPKTMVTSSTSAPAIQIATAAGRNEETILSGIEHHDKPLPDKSVPIQKRNEVCHHVRNQKGHARSLASDVGKFAKRRERIAKYSKKSGQHAWFLN